MHHLTKVKYIQKLNEEELKRGISMNASWHMKYKDSAYIYIGGIPFEMTEGDLVIVFSQYGEIVDCRIIRDKETGKSKGFGFICYEDQRSTILAVDNLNGASVAGRTFRVDHVEQYRIPREYLETDEVDENGEKKIYKPSGPDGKGWGEDRILTPEENKVFELLRSEEERRISGINQMGSMKNMVMDADEKWEREFLNIVNKTKEEELKKKKEERKKKKAKKEKKKRKKEKELKKEKINKQKTEEEMKEIYKSYGISK